MRDRHGALLRVYPVEDGRIRMAMSLAAVNDDFNGMLIAYEDNRFYSHPGVDVIALARAAGDAIWWADRLWRIGFDHAGGATS
ncbi:MAG: transglycosylase domain-containing protein [Pseudomonadota bacterium]